MKSNFDKAYSPVKRFEGGYCNVSGDSGGETYAGIARNFFPNWQGWCVIDEAKKHESFGEGSRAFSNYLSSNTSLHFFVPDFYKLEFWDKLGICVLPQALADEIFEQAVNLGMGGAGKCVQRACNALNYKKTTGTRYFDDLIVDGVIGNKTLTALQLLLVKQDAVSEFVRVLNGMQISHYVNLGAKNYHHRKFLTGWLTRTL